MATKKVATYKETELLGKGRTLPFKKHMCLIGPKGEGKTYGVTRFASVNKIPTVKIIGHAGIEARDLLGYIKPTEKGVFSYHYGQLSKAFRSAKEGGKTILIIDEMLRIPPHELSVLIGALTPDSDGKLTLNTGASIPLGDTFVDEVLVIDQEQLWVVATTNYGAEYGIRTIEEAFKDRFRFIYHTLSDKSKEKIITDAVKANGWDTNIVPQLIKLSLAVSSLVKEQKLGSALNIRQIIECLSIPDEQTTVALAEQLTLLDQAICLLSDNGSVNNTQKLLYYKAIQDSLGINL